MGQLNRDVLDKFDLHNAHKIMNWKEKYAILYKMKIRKIGMSLPNTASKLIFLTALFMLTY